MRVAPAHEALVLAAFAPIERARPAFEEWSRQVDVQTLDFASQRLLPLVARRSDLPPGPEGLDEQLRRITRFVWVRTQYLIGRVVPALRGLEEAGIPAMLVKGAGVILHTGIEVHERPMNDFDVMVPRPRAPEAVEVIRAAGFSSPGFPRDPHRTHVYDEIPGYNFRDAVTGELDIHWAWSSRGMRPGGTDSWWKAARPAALRDQPCLVACREDLVLQAIAHATQFSVKDSPSRWLPDTILLVRSAAGSFDWDRLISQARAFRLTLAVADALDSAHWLDCLTVPDEVRRALATGRRRAGAVERIDLRPIPPGWEPGTRHTNNLELVGDRFVAWHRRTFPPRSKGVLARGVPLLALAGALTRRTGGGDEALSIRLGEEILFKGPMPHAGLIDGWYTPDDSGVWCGRRGRLKIDLAEPVSGPVKATLVVVPLLSAARPTLRVGVYSAGRRIATWHFSGTGWQPEHRTATIPPAGGGHRVQLELRVNRPASPNTLGIDGDIRILGLHLISLRIDALSESLPPAPSYRSETGSPAS